MKILLFATVVIMALWFEYAEAQEMVLSIMTPVRVVADNDTGINVGDGTTMLEIKADGSAYIASKTPLQISITAPLTDNDVVAVALPYPSKGQAQTQRLLP